MRKFSLLFSVLFFCCFAASAQKTTGVIRGVLIDTTGKLPLLGATVSVIFTKDSTMASFTLSDKTGMFEIKDLADDSYKLHVSFKGLDHIKNHFP